jgi:hypothetical protein
MKDEFLIDRFMPSFDAVERHAVTVAADPARVYAAIRTTDLTRSWVVRVLLAMRGLRRARKVTIDSPLLEAFQVIDEDPPRELLIALEGPFWYLLCQPRAVGRNEPQAPGTARAAWNFRVEASHGGARLSTETRVHCADAASRRKFRVYWFFVRPFSGIIRRFMLRAIRDEAELSSRAKERGDASTVWR